MLIRTRDVRPSQSLPTCHPVYIVRAPPVAYEALQHMHHEERTKGRSTGDYDDRAPISGRRQTHCQSVAVHALYAECNTLNAVHTIRCLTVPMIYL